MNLGSELEHLLREQKDGYKVAISDDYSLICLWSKAREIEVYRTNGGYLINKIGSKVESRELIDVVWNGTTLYCCYSNGSVSMFKEGRELVKQLVLMPKGSRTKCLFCDILQLDEDFYALSEGNLLKTMPKLNKWNMIKNELDNVLIIDDEFKKSRTVDLFITVDHKTNKLIISIEGTLNIKVGDKVKLPKDANKIIRISNGKYLCFNKSFEFQIIDLTFLQDQNTYKMIKATQEYSILLKYLKQLHRHMGMKLTEPYFQYIDDLLKDSHKAAIKDLFYMGVSNTEMMEELKDTQLQKFRLDKLKAMSSELCDSSIGLIVSCMSPLLERMVVLGATIESLCEAITWIKFPEDTFSSDIRQQGMALLESMNSQIPTIIDIKRSHKAGFVWLQALSEKLAADTEPQDHSDNSDYKSMFIVSAESANDLMQRADLARIEMFLTKDLEPTSQFEWVKNKFPSMILKLQGAFDSLMKDYTLRWLKKQITGFYSVPVLIPTLSKLDIHDTKILTHSNHILALLATPTELILVNLDANTIETRTHIPLESRQIPTTLSQGSAKESHSPQFQLISNLHSNFDSHLNNHTYMLSNPAKSSDPSTFAYEFCLLPSHQYVSITVTVDQTDVSRDLKSSIHYKIIIVT